LSTWRGCAPCRTRRRLHPRSSPGAITEHTSAAASKPPASEYRSHARDLAPVPRQLRQHAGVVVTRRQVGQLSLAFGANDMGSVMIEENVVRRPGPAYCMDRSRDCSQCRRRRFRRQAPQHALRHPGDPFFREHAVPRTLELSTAREAGDNSVPAELVNYPARSRAPHVLAAAGGRLSHDRPTGGWSARSTSLPSEDAFARFTTDASFCRESESSDSAQGQVGSRERVTETRDLGNVVLLPGLINAHFISSCRALRGRCRPARSSPIGSAAWSHAGRGVERPMIHGGRAAQAAIGTAGIRTVAWGHQALRCLARPCARRPRRSRLDMSLLGFVRNVTAP